MPECVRCSAPVGRKGIACPERRAEPYTNGQLATIIKRSWQQSPWGRSR